MMDNVTMKKSQLVLSIAACGALIALSGCQTISSHNPFRHRAPPYATARQAQPLEVPPGLDNPPNAEALAIPTAGGNGSSMPPVTVNGEPVAAPSGTSVGEPSAAPAYPAVSGNTLTLADDPDSAYRRVGFALQRGGVGTVSGRNDSAHTYQVAVNSVVTTGTQSQGGFFHRMLHRSHSETHTVTGTVNVSIAPSGSGSVVSVQGDADAVERVLSMLQQRLGGS